MFLKKLLVQFMSLAFLLAVSTNLFASAEGDIAVVAGAKPISLSQAEAFKNEANVYFVDVNPSDVRDEFGYIPGAILASEEEWATQVPADKEATLVFYCLNRLCSGSGETAVKAQNAGYKNVYVMQDGLEGWVTSGRPAEKVKLERWLKATEVKDYKDRIHKDLVFAEIPACRDCHGTNGIKANLANDKNTVNTNCASCHKEEKTLFSDSVHTEKLERGTLPPGTKLFNNTTSGTEIEDEAAIPGQKKEIKKKKDRPICWDCHNVHATDKTVAMNKKQMSDEKCSKCHEEQAERYYTTFHGKAVHLSSSSTMPKVAACYDCHGKHNVMKVTEAQSTLFGAQKIETCKKCHEGSNKNFVGYIAHADHTNKDKYPVLYHAYIFMTALIVCVFAFFGLHTFLWSIRLILMRLRNKEAWKAAREEAHKDTVALRRFTTLHRIQHFFMAASFLGLSFSGLPQKFYTSPWAQSIMDFIGGPINATRIHHVSAVIMCLVFGSHIAEVIIRAWSKRDKIRDQATGKMSGMLFLKALFGPDSLVPRWQDFRDMGAHVKWFFNLGPRPQFDRWTYWEKFDYLAVFWGMFIIGFSGMMLWFPTFFSLVLPGWMLNLATLVHSDEALLATGFIFAIHFFNTHFRADRFPMDMVIFSGTLTRNEMLQERGPWYERLEKEGKLNAMLEENGKFNKMKPFARIIGGAMLITGLIFLFLIIYALVTSL